MQIAHCHLRVNNVDTVAKNNVTPAEVQLMREMFRGAVGGDPIGGLEVQGNFEAVNYDSKGVPHSRTDAEEKARLLTLYTGKNKAGLHYVEQCFPGKNPKLPQTFAEVKFVAEENVESQPGVATVPGVAATVKAPEIKK